MRATFDVDAHLRKQMIEFLFEAGFWNRERLTWHAAQARFDACLNPGKKEFFKLSELWALMKRFDRHELFLAMAADLDYQVPHRLATAERHQALLERIAEEMARANAVGERALADMQVLAAGAPDASVHPAFHEGVGKFCVGAGDDHAIGGF